MTLIFVMLIVFKKKKGIVELRTTLLFFSTCYPVALKTDPMFFNEKKFKLLCLGFICYQFDFVTTCFHLYNLNVFCLLFNL